MIVSKINKGREVEEKVIEGCGGRGRFREREMGKG